MGLYFFWEQTLFHIMKCPAYLTFPLIEFNFLILLYLFQNKWVFLLCGFVGAHTCNQKSKGDHICFQGTLT